jgi:hypothetical protein
MRFINLYSAAVLVFTAVSGFAQAGFCDSMRTSLRHVPAKPNVNCDDFAYAEGKRLAQVSGVSAVDVRCFSDDFGNELPYWNLNISYEADAAIQPVSTFDYGSTSHPGFATQALCEGALKNESSTFARLSGLTAFATYCRVPTNRSESWHPVVLGFGPATAKPFTHGIAIFGELVGYTASSFDAMVRDGFTKLGAQVGLTSFERDVVYNKFAINYFAKERLDFEVDHIAAFSSKEACAQNLTAAKDALAASGVMNIATFCRAYLAGKIELLTVRDSRSRLTLSETDPVYDSVQACEGQKAAVVDHYRSALHRDIKAAFCSIPVDLSGRPNTKVKVVMIEKR